MSAKQASEHKQAAQRSAGHSDSWGNALTYPPCPTPNLAQLTPFSPFSLERAQHSRVGTVARRQGHGRCWPRYNRKVAACTRTCRILRPQLSSRPPTRLPALTHCRGPAPREACPTRCDCVLHSYAIIIPGGSLSCIRLRFAPFLDLLFSASILREQLSRLPILLIQHTPL